MIQSSLRELLQGIDSIVPDTFGLKQPETSEVNLPNEIAHSLDKVPIKDE